MARPKALTPAQIELVRKLLLDPGNTMVGIARELGVSRATIYRVWTEHEMDRNRYGLSAGGHWTHRFPRFRNSGL